MANVIWIDDVPHRKRRGKLVSIPTEWFGRTVSHQQISRRYSKNSIKKIESRQDRARDQDALARGEEPNSRKQRTKWYGASGRTDKHRDKFRSQRRASHPSNEEMTDTGQ